MLLDRFVAEADEFGGGRHRRRGYRLVRGGEVDGSSSSAGVVALGCAVYFLVDWVGKLVEAAPLVDVDWAGGARLFRVWEDLLVCPEEGARGEGALSMQLNYCGALVRPFAIGRRLRCRVFRWMENVP